MTNGHPYQDADYDLYALGALRGEECAAIESHVASCPECAHKLAEARGRIALLALAADPLEPSPGVKEALMRQLNASAEGPIARVYVPEPRRSSFFSAAWWTAVWAPAAVALALVTIFLWVQTVKLSDQLSNQHAAVIKLQSQIEQTQTLVDLFAARDSVHVSLSPSREARGATGNVLYNARLGKILFADTLNAPPPNKSYQLWLVPTTGDPISAAVLNTSTTPGEQLIATVPPGTTPKAFAVTIEPQGGSPQPTGPKVLIGAL